MTVCPAGTDNGCGTSYVTTTSPFKAEDADANRSVRQYSVSDTATCVVPVWPADARPTPTTTGTETRCRQALGVEGDCEQRAGHAVDEVPDGR